MMILLIDQFILFEKSVGHYSSSHLDILDLVCVILVKFKKNIHHMNTFETKNIQHKKTNIFKNFFLFIFKNKLFYS
jgi:hypothetical protein